MAGWRYLLSTLVLSCTCACGGGIKRPYSAPKKVEIASHLAGQRDRAMSFRHQSVMDYWVGDERVRGKVFVMGRRGARVRFNALNPTGDNVAVDMACDGRDFKYVNMNENCVLYGPCSKDAIAQLLRINLEPDDFLLLAVGQAPLVSGEVDIRSTWDEDRGHEVVTFRAKDGRVQELRLDGRDKRWDVIESTLRDKAGKVLWKLENKDFRQVEGSSLRLPKKTRFRQPPIKADLVVSWKKQETNLELSDDKFSIQLPEGLRQCGQ